MAVFDFKNSPEEKAKSVCTYAIFKSNESEPSADKPIMVIDNRQQQWKHHSNGVFTNPVKRTAFEFKEDTVLGGKFRLSEGQEQRLAIARAVYSDSEVIVLDEPTSALDIKTEEEVVKNLISLNKTLVVISHRPSFEKVATVKVEL
jgi:ABC-type multidrug transport system fused ATPase/permease subunit